MGDVPGFLSRHVAVRHFIMHVDLTKAQDELETLDAFQSFRESFEAAQQKHKHKLFLRLALKQLKKHFDIWINKLHFLALCSEQQTAQMFAKVLLNHSSDRNKETTTHTSTAHKRDLKSGRLMHFLKTRSITVQDVQAFNHAQPHLSAVKLIAEGKNMWSTNQTDQIPLASVTMRQHCLERHSAFPSSSHSAESTVEDANCCSVQNSFNLIAKRHRRTLT